MTWAPDSPMHPQFDERQHQVHKRVCKVRDLACGTVLNTEPKHLLTQSAMKQLMPCQAVVQAALAQF